MVRRPPKQDTKRGQPPTGPSRPSAPAPPPTLAALRKELYALADPADAIHLQRFFKTAPGEYGAGDKFLGLRVPTLRGVKKYRTIGDADALEMLASSWHEERLLALMLLVDQYGRGDGSRRSRIHATYLAHTRHINNWDLVDASAAQIIGSHLDARDVGLLERLARSDGIWERRIAIVATFISSRRMSSPDIEIAGLLVRDSTI